MSAQSELGHLQRIGELNTRLNQEINSRLTVVEPLAKAVIQALDAWCDVAENPSHPGRPAALRLLSAWKATMRRVDQVASGIVIAQTPPKNGST